MKWTTARIRLPIVAQLRDYRLSWLKVDLAAGLSVAAVSLPSAIAYPAIAGLPTEVGLFATIFSMLGYALLGPSRKLMVGPDTATCIMLAGVLTSLGAVTETDRLGLTLILTFTVGIFFLAAAALRLGFVANFLSRPILVGFLAGIAISLIIGQLTRLTAVPIEAQGLVSPIAEFVRHIGGVHIPTLLVGLGTLVFLRVLRRMMPSMPAPLLAIVLSIALSTGMGLQSLGVATVGALPHIVFALSLPSLDGAVSLDLLAGALAIMLVGFGSGIVTARSFAMKNRDDVDADRELLGFGAANIFSGLFGGFPVSASDSRTAINFVAGGKTQLVALVAAAALAGIVLFIVDLIAYLPTATLGAILISAAIDLIDLGELRTLGRISRAELACALVAMLGVVIVGVLQGVFIAITATLMHLLWVVSRPRIALLGRIPGDRELRKLHRYPKASQIPGLNIVTVQSAIVFFNADFVKRRLLRIANMRRASTKWFILDAGPMNELDSTGVLKLEELRQLLAAMGMTFGVADLNSAARKIFDRAGLSDRIGKHMVFPSVEAAVTTFENLSTDQRR